MSGEQPRRQGSKGPCKPEDHRPKSAIWFLALPFLILFMVLRPVGCGFVWFGRFLRWLVRPRTLLGLAFLLPWVVVFHVMWFAHGWSAFRPLCYQDWGYPFVELMGPMSVEATDAFHDFFVAWLGSDSVRRFGSNQIDIRPALRLMPTDILWNYTGKVAANVADQQGTVDQQGRSPFRCSFIEEVVMEDGKAESYSKDWGYWPYNEMDENASFWRYLINYHQPTQQSQ